MIYNQTQSNFFKDLYIEEPLGRLLQNKINTDMLKQDIANLVNTIEQITDRINFVESWHSFDIEPEINVPFIVQRIATQEEIQEYNLKEHEKIEYGIGKRTRKTCTVAWLSGDTVVKAMSDFENKKLHSWKYL